MPINCLSINARGLNHPAKRLSMWKEATTHKADVLCVQETHFQLTKAPSCSHKDYPHVYMACTPEKKKAGVLIALRNTVSFQQKDIVLDPNGRYIILKGDINSKPYTLVSLYAPNTHQSRFINRLFKKIQHHIYGNLIICGDFNLIIDPKMDTSASKPHSSSYLSKTIHQAELYDVWRCKNANARDYTFFSHRHCSYSRIDLFLTDKWLLQNISCAKIHDITWSDHAAITITIDDQVVSSSSPIWRSNIRLLQDPKTSTKISQHIKEFFQNNVDSVENPFTLWNAHKAYMRGILIQIGAREKKRRNAHIDSILKNIHILGEQNKQKPNATLTQKLSALRDDLRNSLSQQYDYHLRRLKLQSYANANRAGKYLANRLKAVKSKTRIAHLIHPTLKHKVTNPQDIANQFADYYSNLYNIKDDPSTCQPTYDDIQNILQTLKLPTLTESQLLTLNSPFTTAEIAATIETLPNGKSPGPDGFSNEYFKKFKPCLLPHLHSVFTKAATTATFPPEMLQAYIVTLPKPGKDPITPSNFRPISLLNSDIKIYAKLITRRLTTYIPSLIQKDQMGFVRGRQTSDATRRIINIIHHAELTKTPSLLLSIDAEKAFDRVNWKYMSMTLSKYGFSGNMLNAILALYSCPSARVYTSSMLSTPFQISNGTRQGCPLSPTIFDLMIEPLAEAIRSRAGVTGFQFGATTHLINLFADDVILFLTNPRTSLPTAHEILTSFGNVSYYKVNCSKSLILDLGVTPKDRTTLQHSLPYTWSSKGIPYLGITLTNHTSSLIDANLKPLITKLTTQVTNIAKHEISWLGRLAALKMLILPQILYTFRVLPITIPEHYLKSLSSLQWKLLWGTKKARCSQATLIPHKRAGGAGLIDVHDYMWATRLDQIKYWFSPNEVPLWVEIEKTLAPIPDLPSILIGDSWIPWNLKQLPPTISISIKAWRFLLSRHGPDHRKLDYKLPLSIVEANIPMISLKSFPSQQVNNVQDLYHNKTPKSAACLMKDHNMPHNMLFTCLRVAHLTHKHPWNDIHLPTPVWQHLTQGSLHNKGISLYYNLLQGKTKFQKSKTHFRWDRDMETSISDKQWQFAFKTIQTASHCTTHWETSLKVIHRWQYTPSRLSKMFPNTSPLCWRECGHKGHLLHMFWECPNVTSFWNNIFKLLGEITGVLTPPDPKLAILLIGLEGFPYSVRHVVTHILLVARSLILSNWKSAPTLNITDVTRKVQQHYIF